MRDHPYRNKVIPISIRASVANAPPRLVAEPCNKVGENGRGEAAKVTLLEIIEDGPAPIPTSGIVPIGVGILLSVARPVGVGAGGNKVSFPLGRGICEKDDGVST